MFKNKIVIYGMGGCAYETLKKTEIKENVLGIVYGGGQR